MFCSINILPKSKESHSAITLHKLNFRFSEAYLCSHFSSFPEAILKYYLLSMKQFPCSWHLATEYTFTRSSVSRWNISNATCHAGEGALRVDTASSRAGIMDCTFINIYAERKGTEIWSVGCIHWSWQINGKRRQSWISTIAYSNQETMLEPEGWYALEDLKRIVIKS